MSVTHSVPSVSARQTLATLFATSLGQVTVPALAVPYDVGHCSGLWHLCGGDSPVVQGTHLALGTGPGLRELGWGS